MKEKSEQPKAKAKLTPEQKTAMLANMRDNIDAARMKKQTRSPMFDFKSGGKKYFVAFQHYTHVCAGTRCYIYDETGKYEVKGDAFLSKEDQFNRNKGRKVALAKAVKQLVMPKSLRKTRIWETYFAIHGRVE